MLLRRLERSVDLRVEVGSVTLPNPVMTAAGTAGHGTELAAYIDLGALGAHVVKSLSAHPWAGNPGPRVAEVDAGMINAIGLQNPGIAGWINDDLPAIRGTKARLVVSIWGFRVDDYAEAAAALAAVAGDLVAVEVNVSCPNIEDRRHMFGHSCDGTAAVIGAVRRTLPPSLPVWAKLSPNVTDLTEIAGAALDAGAEGLTLINTVMGLAIDPETRRPRLGNGGGGLSGPAIRPVAVRAIAETRRAYPDAAIIGVGGVTKGVHAVELLLAGANAVQVGTASFADPRATIRILAELTEWCRRHGVGRVAELVGAGLA